MTESARVPALARWREIVIAFLLAIPLVLAFLVVVAGLPMWKVTHSNAWWQFNDAPSLSIAFAPDSVLLGSNCGIWVAPMHLALGPHDLSIGEFVEKQRFRECDKAELAGIRGWFGTLGTMSGWVVFNDEYMLLRGNGCSGVSRREEGCVRLGLRRLDYLPTFQ
jgi:hypothetical protein